MVPLLPRLPMDSNPSDDGRPCRRIGRSLNVLEHLEKGNTVSLETSLGRQPLRPGDVVEVRPVNEILATLDKHGTLDGMPFMPEMIAHTGRRYTVTRRVDKICNTVDLSGSRRMRSTVYLEDLRCDGSGHGGCQAGCKIYWKEAWLRRVDDHSGARGADNADTAV